MCVYAEFVVYTCKKGWQRNVLLLRKSFGICLLETNNEFHFWHINKNTTRWINCDNIELVQFHCHWSYYVFWCCWNQYNSEENFWNCSCIADMLVDQIKFRQRWIRFFEFITWLLALHVIVKNFPINYRLWALMLTIERIFLLDSNGALFPFNEFPLFGYICPLQ